MRHRREKNSFILALLLELSQMMTKILLKPYSNALRLMLKRMSTLMLQTMSIPILQRMSLPILQRMSLPILQKTKKTERILLVSAKLTKVLAPRIMTLNLGTRRTRTLMHQKQN